MLKFFQFPGQKPSFPPDRDLLNLSSLSEQTHRPNWYSLLDRILLTEVILAGLGMIFDVFVLLFVQQFVLVLVIGLTFGFFLLNLLTWLYLKNQPIQSRGLEIATGLTLGSYGLAVGAAILILGANSGVISLFFWLPVLTGILGLSLRVLVFTTGLTIAGMVSFLLLENIKVYRPIYDIARELIPLNIAIWVLSMLLVLVGLVVFSNQLRGALQEVRRQQAEVADLYARLKKVHLYATEHSNTTANSALELNAASGQLVTGSQEQLTFIQEITTNMQQLSETANRIADNATLVARTTDQVVERVDLIRIASQNAEIIADQGRSSVEKIIHTTTQAEGRVEALTEHLGELTSLNQQVSQLSSFIHSLANDTHLLALNASIEAAGIVGDDEIEVGAATYSGRGHYQANSVAIRNQGRRFEVIASEVRNLSDSVQNFVKQIEQLLNQVQEVQGRVILTAEETRHEIAQTLSQSRITGQVIEQLYAIVTEEAEKTEEIAGTIEQVSQNYEEVVVMTNQQQAATSQIVLAVQDIASITHQGASALIQMNDSINQISQQTHELNFILSKAQPLAA